MSVPITIVEGQPAVEIADAQGEVFVYFLAARPVAGRPSWSCYSVRRTEDPEQKHAHTVSTDGTHWECTCGAWRYRRRWNRESCKHIDTLKNMGPWLKAV